MSRRCWPADRRLRPGEVGEGPWGGWDGPSSRAGRYGRDGREGEYGRCEEGVCMGRGRKRCRGSHVDGLSGVGRPLLAEWQEVGSLW